MVHANLTKNALYINLFLCAIPVQEIVLNTHTCIVNCGPLRWWKVPLRILITIKLFVYGCMAISTNELWQCYTLHLSLAPAVLIINLLLTLSAYSACVRVMVVVYSFYLSVTTLTATHLVFKSQMKCHKVLYGVFNRCIVWISLKTLRSNLISVVCLQSGSANFPMSSRRTVRAARTLSRLKRVAFQWQVPWHYLKNRAAFFKNFGFNAWWLSCWLMNHDIIRAGLS